MKAIQLGMFMFGAVSLLACGVEERARDGGDSDGDSDSDSDSADGDDSDDAADDTSMTEKKCNKMDIIFVVDDSASMDAEQANLGHNFPEFANILSTYETADGDPLDYRIAVTTTGKTFTMNLGMGLPPITETGDNGAFKDGCGVSRRWIEPGDGTSPLSCRANVGIEGPGNEMPFQATKLALDDRMTDGTNAGFLRDDALLAVVILTDEDDTSNTGSSATVDFSNPQVPTNYHAADLISFLDAKKGNRTKWAAGVIAGDPPAGQDACSGQFGDAIRATRLKEFVTMANSQGTTQAVFSSICQGDLTQGLQAALTTFQSACEVIVQ